MRDIDQPQPDMLDAYSVTVRVMNDGGPYEFTVLAEDSDLAVQTACLRLLDVVDERAMRSAVVEDVRPARRAFQ